MNKVMLIGNVGLEPEVRYFEADKAVARVRLATTERGYTLPNGTKIPDRTDWHTLFFDRNLAKYVERYVHKGHKLYIEGRIRYRVYNNKRGERCTSTEIWVENMELLTPRQVNEPSVDQPKTADAPDTPQDGLEKLPF